MALDRATLALALRIPDPGDDGDGPLLDRLAVVADAMTGMYASGAPDGVRDEAGIRLAGWLYDRPPEQGADSAMSSSGAGALLDQWRRRAFAVFGETVAPTPDASGLPPLPGGDGHYILAVDDGVLTWLPFPKP